MKKTVTITILFFVFFLSININYIYCTELFSDGFESGDFSAWSSTGGTDTRSVITTDPYDGSYHMDSDIDGSGTPDNAYAEKIFSQSYSIIYGQAYFKISALPDDSGETYQLIQFRSSIGYIVVGGIKNVDGTNCKFRLYVNSGGGTEVIGTSIVQTNVYYQVEMYIKIDGTNGEAKLWVDGTLECSMSGDTDDQGNVDRIRVGQIRSTASVAHHIYTDKVTVSDTYVGGGQSYSRTANLSFSWSGNLDRIWTLERIKNLSLNFIFSFDRVWNLERIKSLPITFSANLDRTWTLSRVISETITFVFNAYGRTGLMFSRTINLILNFNINIPISRVYYIPDIYATKGYVLATLFLIALICLPIITLIWMERK
ncbi:MAG: hypothetical protein ACTSX6_10485 [Candidatus Heimdallarchaeaceae archaeon]